MLRLGHHDHFLFLNRTSLESHRFINLLAMFYTILNKHVSCNVVSYFDLPAHNFHLSGYKYKLLATYCRTNIRKTNFSVNYTCIWSRLPLDIVCLTVIVGSKYHSIAV